MRRGTIGTGRGQGYVTFSVQVRADARPGTQVTNSAAIVFDTNPPTQKLAFTALRIFTGIVFALEVSSWPLHIRLICWPRSHGTQRQCYLA